MFPNRRCKWGLRHAQSALLTQSQSKKKVSNSKEAPPAPPPRRQAGTPPNPEGRSASRASRHSRSYLGGPRVLGFAGTSVFR